MNEKKELLRLFYAVELPAGIRENISKYTNKYKSLPDKVRWTAIENLHLTLRFLGNVESGQVSSLERILIEISSKISPFLYSLKGVGCFPNIKKANVIWVGASNGADSLKLIAGYIEEHLSKLGFLKDDREFTPHVTISRFKDRRARLTETFQKFLTDDKDIFFGEFSVTNISLIKSVLTTTGPVYTTLFKSMLK